MTTIYIISNSIFFNFGEPLYVFFGVLFYFFVGLTCIAYIYVLTTIDLIINIPSILALGDSTQIAMTNLAPEITFIPSFIYITVFVVGVYFTVTISIISCFFIIKKLHLQQRFSFLH
jgi:hypothetical protein